MIGRLSGVVLERKPPELLVDVNGVGYELEASMNTFYALPESGEPVTLYTHMVVREDAQLLYGFAAERERRMFRELIRVRGVGAKLALAILSGMSAEEFVGCVNEENTTALVRLPGVGKKTAERLIIEMRDRLKEWDSFSPKIEGAATTVAAVATDSQSEAVHALISLGYKPQDASRLVNAVAGADELSSQEVIRMALKQSVKL
ncbi:MAG: Holliday junction branch migration protein RuvA [Gammaproteobacteria bacterium]|jgi:Holliday junction DNA helicase RuvA|nr:Holliday junction branch migration protein RuvA [Gammaproteobacteria bacterium]MBT4606332.1 Holliday junction branch migration protein RuvA [Thiotrichales bacterium]MBT3472492.1 Holliday junction branch migration protein RuvA [Gammaproteobacteria bacterium]MBT3966040.1 Holliday junction branch migration protein RuvA [Gammaproteobacteria bacterium]MBT4079451.1 Holliday junction branch migration protein RuvA [Gammaproteobacteria bacterium]